LKYMLYTHLMEEVMERRYSNGTMYYGMMYIIIIINIKVK